MARKKTSALDDLMEIGMKLPWQAALVLAVLAYFGFHYLATLPPVPTVIADPKQMGQAMGATVVRQFAITFGTFLQYLVPVALLIGAAIAAFKRRRQSALHQSVAVSPNRNALEQMNWRQFEGLVTEVFRRKGFEVVERGGSSPDGGVDVELRAGKDKYLVQCKQWKVTKVGVATVRELYGVMAAEGAVGGFVVASGEFTEEAKRFAEGRSIELVPTDVLLRLVQQTAGDLPAVQAASMVEPVCPKCGSQMVMRTAKKGENAGASFWGCSQYPACRGTRSAGVV